VDADSNSETAEQIVDSTRTMQFPEVTLGAALGPYKLIRQLGEGGMGLVYYAQQLQPIRRDVALKVIKPGMDSKVVIGRFESERQALALMDHPNIARVFDAGATQAGRPYFVMELVDGVPITRYCDSKRLTAKERSISTAGPIAQPRLFMRRRWKRGVAGWEMTTRARWTACLGWRAYIDLKRNMPKQSRFTSVPWRHGVGSWVKSIRTQ
jgi:hypothetical protein